jgi:hypothetical protein
MHIKSLEFSAVGTLGTVAMAPQNCAYMAWSERQLNSMLSGLKSKIFVHEWSNHELIN